MKKLKEGIVYSDGKFSVDFQNDTDSDMVPVAETSLYASKLNNNVYYFGYKFNPDVHSKIRAKFIRWLKGIGNYSIDDTTLESLIALPLNELNKEVNLSEFKCILYPRSGRSELVKKIHSAVLGVMPRTVVSSFELVKSIPNKVSFDWDSFDALYSGNIGDNQYKQIRQYIDDEVMPKIHCSQYFSLADNVKPKYRKFITNYLEFESEEAKRVFSAVECGKVLVLDDINTSGSTLREILRILKALNPQVEIYIFTLFGNEQ